MKLASTSPKESDFEYRLRRRNVKDQLDKVRCWKENKKFVEYGRGARLGHYWDMRSEPEEKERAHFDGCSCCEIYHANLILVHRSALSIGHMARWSLNLLFQALDAFAIWLWANLRPLLKKLNSLRGVVESPLVLATKTGIASLFLVFSSI